MGKDMALYSEIVSKVQRISCGSLSPGETPVEVKKTVFERNDVNEKTGEARMVLSNR